MTLLQVTEDLFFPYEGLLVYVLQESGKKKKKSVKTWRQSPRRGCMVVNALSP